MLDLFNRVGFAKLPKEGPQFFVASQEIQEKRVVVAPFRKQAHLVICETRGPSIEIVG
jgi:hypothetical protein